MGCRFPVLPPSLFFHTYGLKKRVGQELAHRVFEDGGHARNPQGALPREICEVRRLASTQDAFAGA